MGPIQESKSSFYDVRGADRTYNHMAVPWAWADTPFSWTKQIASHFGGTRRGVAISWPDVIKNKGGIRNQFHHVIDIVPTILEAAHITQPEVVEGIKQSPIEGVSMMYTLDQKNENAPSTQTTLYFEMMGDRAVYNDGWMAGTSCARLGKTWRPSKVCSTTSGSSLTRETTGRSTKTLPPRTQPS